METEFDWSKITADKMFGNVMDDPETCKLLIEAIFPDMRIKKLEVQTQKRVADNEQNKGVMFDVWVKDDQGRQYDIEMQLGEKKDMDLRARYYMSRLDTKSLHSGKDYADLEAAYVIFICGFDPKKQNRKEYDFKYYCKQDKSLALGTKTEIIYLNSTGTEGEVSISLQDFFNMMNNEATIDTELVKRSKKGMLAYSQTPEWRKYEMYVDKKVDEAKKETAEELIVDTIMTFKSDGVEEKNILNFLTQAYGKRYSEDELKKFIDEAK